MYVRAHRRSSSFEPNVTALGLERDFYGDQADTRADDNITALEAELAATVRALNSERADAITNSERAKLVAALSIRSKAAREGLKALAPQLLSALRSAVEKTTIAEREFDKLATDHARIQRMVDEKVGVLPGLDRNGRLKQAVLIKARLMAELRAHKDSIIANIKAEAGTVLLTMEKEAERAADNAFLSVLRKSALPDMRVTRFDEFAYEIIESPATEPFILGDGMVVGIQSDGTPKLAIGDVDDDLLLVEVWLPISPTRALRGVKSRGGEFRTAHEVNQLSAKLSTDFFISSTTESLPIEELRGLIGTAEGVLTTEEVEELMLSLD